jgi:prepilin-type N-terminal cleavage/methylation domain-containing protein
MTARAAARRGYAGQRGTTLIELLITIAVLAVGFVALLSAFGETELAVGATSDDAQLVTRARAVSDIIQSEGFAYQWCAVGASYGAALDTALSKAGVNTSGVVVLAAAQALSTSTHVIGVGGPSTPLTPKNSCAGTGSAPDYGVQQIKFAVRSSAGHSVVRIVYKRWN